MKTSIKQLIIAAFVVLTTITSTFASETTSNVTLLKEVKNINKIVASGNVNVVVMQAASESVTVFDRYYAKNALVQQKDGVLRISSFGAKPLTVTVYVSNLKAIEANDNATISTYGKVGLLTLDLTVKDNAKADIDVQTVYLTTTVKDNGELKISGFTEEHFAKVSAFASMTTGHFVANHTEVKSIASVYKAQAKSNILGLEDISINIDLAK